MTQRFREAHKRTQGHEGFYANEDWDDGGETYRGISRVYNPDWEGWPLIDQYKKAYGKPLPWNHYIKSEHLDELVLQRYYERYWMPLRADEIRGDALTDLLFDFYVQSGANAVKALQEAVNLLENNKKLYCDGVIGPKTLAACNALPHAQVHDMVKAIRRQFLINWAERKKKPESVLASVLRRVDKFPDQYT